MRKLESLKYQPQQRDKGDYHVLIETPATRRVNNRVTELRAGSGFQPAMVLAQARAFILSMTPGNRRRKLDRSRQLSLLIEDGADRSSIGLGDDEHPIRMAMYAAAGKP